MSLQIIAGSSGAGKSYTIYQELIQSSIAHLERTFLVIVPEQFTMQTQKDLVRMHPRHGLLNLDVLSFNRLAWRVFEEVGGGSQPVLDDLGKSLVLQRVISQNSAELQVLSRILGKPGAVEAAKSLVSELLQYRVRPQDLEKWIAGLPQGRSLLGLKLEDVRVLYQGFLDYLENRFLTVEEVPERLCSVIGESKLVRDAEIVLDGFTGFTPVQHQVVKELMRLAASVRAIVTADRQTDLTRAGGPQRLFHMSCRVTGKLYELARDAACEILPARWIGGRERGRFCQNPPLQFLEQNLFRYRRAVFTEKQDRLQMFCAADPREEVAYLVSEISRLVRKEGYRYRDFAVVTGDLEHYGREISRRMEREEIPFFLDQKQSVLANPLIEFLRAAVDMVIRGFSYESVFRCLRSGLTDFSPEEIDQLENYCLGVGIRGWKQYQERWIRLPRHMKPEAIEEINRLRERFVEMFGSFTEGMRARGITLQKRAEVLYRLMEQLDLQQKLAGIEHWFDADGARGKAREYAQIYPLVIELLDRMAAILGGEVMGMTAFQQILEAGFAELRVGLIPPGEDQVMVGDIERTRLKHVKVLFFAGVNEGIVPRTSKGDGILSEADRSILEAAQIELAPKGRTLMYQQRLYLYLTMTKPCDRLYLSYSETGTDGSALMPSYLVGVIRKLFPALEPAGIQKLPEFHQMETVDGFLDAAISGIRRSRDGGTGTECEPAGSSGVTDAESEPAGRSGVTDAESEPAGQSNGTGAEIESAGPSGSDMPDDLAAELISSMEPSLAKLLLRAAMQRNPAEGLREGTAKALYGTHLVHSATRLERFAACAFAHFVQYGLQLSERDEYTFTPADMGTIMHSALERFSWLLEKRNLNWTGLTEQERNGLVDEALDGMVHDYGNTILHSSRRNTWMIQRIRRILYRTVWALQEQLRRSSFVPARAEAAFRSDELQAMQVRLSGGEQMQLQGRIDRIDLCDADGVRYVRVIDYKTGQTRLELDQLYYGLQIQLPLYLNAAIEQVEKTDPAKPAEAAGIYYYNIKDPVIASDRVDARDEDDDTTEGQFLKELRMEGLSRREDQILALLDHTTAERDAAEVIPVSRSKDGTLGKTSRVAGREQFDLIRQFTREKIRALGGQMLEGKTKAEPYLAGQNSACTWCAYRGICGFDERIPGYRYRRLRHMDAESALDLMGGELENTEGTGGSADGRVMDN